MNSKLKNLNAALFVFIASFAFATSGASPKADLKSEMDEAACQFFPPNNLRFPVLSSGQMSKMDFDLILRVAQQTYVPIFYQRGLGRFQILNRWEDDTVNANAYKGQAQTSVSGVMTDIRYVQIYGGLARHPLMTREGLLLAVCHEIGHHLGGYPRYNQDTNWASTEGQSDYFATSKCARIIFGQLTTNAAWLARSAVAFQVRVQCQASFPNDAKEAAICMRSSMGGLSLAKVLASLSSDPAAIDFSHRDPSTVTHTFEGHPQAQCRLDTYFQGAICQISELVSFGLRPGQGACEARITSRGSRPTCWYHDPLQMASSR